MDKVVKEYEEIFTSPVGVPLHCQVKHSINLTLGAPLPIGPIYQCFVLENDEIKRKIQDLLQKATIQVIRDWPSPTTLTELRSFLGLANFYHRFVLGFSHITWPLSQVTKGGANEKFFWSKYKQEAFTELKYHLYSTLVLALPDFQQPFEVKIDAYDYAIGAVLTQHGHPLAYHNETFSDTV
eukprot:PITA_24892